MGNIHEGPPGAVPGGPDRPKPGALQSAYSKPIVSPAVKPSEGLMSLAPPMAYP